MNELIDGKEKEYKQSNFSTAILIFLISIISSGIIMSYIGLSGLPLTIPGIGFLIAHLMTRMIFRSLKRRILLICTLIIVILLSSIIIEIEIFEYLNYGALWVCLFSFLLWFLIELLILKLIKLTRNRSKKL